MGNVEHCSLLSFNVIFSEIFVISIKDSPKREHIKNQLQGLRYTFFDAIVPDIEDPRQRQIVGNRASHKAVLKKAIIDGLRYILVFEDDVILDPDYLNVLSNLNNFIKTRDWAMFYLGGHHRGKSVLFRDREGIMRTKGTIATHAVAYSYWYYKEAIDALSKPNDDPTPIDYCFAGHPNSKAPCFQKQNPCYTLNPTIAYQIPTEKHGLDYWKQSY